MTQQQRQIQTLKMTPQLQQAIKLLPQSHQELLETIQTALQENPYLEVQEVDRSPEEQRQAQEEERAAEPQETTYEQDASRNADWEDYLGDFASSPRDSQQREYQEEEETLSAEQRYSEKPTLSGHLLWQLRLSSLTEEEMAIGELIIGNLDSKGRLQATVEELAEMAKSTPAKVESVLKRIQVFDPIGVACRDLRECLLVQVREKGLDQDPVLVSIISDHLGDFESNRLKPLMHRFKLDEEDLRDYLAVIRSLEPYPGASLGGGEAHYVSPDATVRKVGNDFVIFLNDDDIPQLTISDIPQVSLDGEGKSSAAGKDKKEKGRGRGRDEVKAYCSEKMRDAKWLIRSIEQRSKTLVKVIESVVRHQREFFENGPSGLKPLILNEIAEDIGMHESTVSRITSNKYIATPHGIFLLKYFFNSAVSMSDGSQVGSESVKDLIKKMVDREDKKKPLSDDAIVKELKNQLGVEIARRTVGKYREALNIPSSSKRKKVF
ncbi:MAG: RNA polymerase factor sigma-54 [Desulfovibrionaceae bacterium]|nr:RNA polymerase factor sigma-54 [Desulfovibrionaceae bacterium]